MRRVFSLLKNETTHLKMPPARCVLDAQHTNGIRFIICSAVWQRRFHCLADADNAAIIVCLFGGNFVLKMKIRGYPLLWRKCENSGERIRPFHFDAGREKGTCRSRKRRLFWQRHDDVVGELIRSRERKSSAA